MLRAFVLPTLGLCSVLGATALPEVRLGRTTLHGSTLIEPVEFYGGIPFAEPPLGPLRLRKPILKTRLTTPSFNASSHGKSCVQPARFADPASISEDCLTINIYRPKGTKTKDKLPILFWTYGGGFVAGSSQLYDGRFLVSRSVARGTPIIYVDFNYRLGPLGYPQGQEADDHRALNLAIHDQTAALEWVHANIHFFGGDKSKVTMFGESAGAMMTGIQFLNPRLEKLARGAIFESGVANGPQTYPAARNEPFWQTFVESIPSCASIAASGATFTCLQNAPTEEIVAGLLQTANLDVLTWAPTIDRGRDSVYPDYVSRLYKEGRFVRLPFIAGVNRDEGTPFGLQSPSTTQDLKTIFLDVLSPPLTTPKELNDTISRALELYPEDPAVGSPYGTGEELFGLPPSFKRHSSFTGDMTFDAPRRQWAQTAAKFGLKSYGYLFSHPQPVPQLGVPHGAEIPYVYGQIPEADTSGFALSTVMMDYWISFTVTLDPNDGKGTKRPRWPQYTLGNQVLLQLEGGNTTVIPDDFRKEQLEYLGRNALVLRR